MFLQLWVEVRWDVCELIFPKGKFQTQLSNRLLLQSGQLSAHCMNRFLLFSLQDSAWEQRLHVWMNPNWWAESCADRAEVGGERRGPDLPLQWVTRRIPCKGYRETHKHQMKAGIASSPLQWPHFLFPGERQLLSMMYSINHRNRFLRVSLYRHNSFYVFHLFFFKTC